MGIFLAAAYLRVEDKNFGPTDPPEPESSFRVSGRDAAPAVRGFLGSRAVGLSP